MSDTSRNVGSKLRIFLLLLGLFSIAGTFGKRFANQYLEFELPPGWKCVLEGAEWVCQSENKERKKEAIIIFAAKKRGDADTLLQYKKYLSRKKTYGLPGGKRQVSEVKFAKISDINGQKWVDALHLASEIPGFYTRYMATVKSDLGVAVTFSVVQSMYSQYQRVFEKMISSLRVFKWRGSTRPKRSIKGGGKNKLAELPPLISFPSGDEKEEKKKKEEDDNFLYIVIGAVVLAFFLIRKK